MFTFCDDLHEENKKRKQTLESAQYGLEISFKILFTSRFLAAIALVNSSDTNLVLRKCLSRLSVDISSYLCFFHDYKHFEPPILISKAFRSVESSTNGEH